MFLFTKVSRTSGFTLNRSSIAKMVRTQAYKSLQFFDAAGLVFCILSSPWYLVFAIYFETQPCGIEFVQKKKAKGSTAQ